MQIIKSDKYINELQEIMEFIAKDGIEKALKFESGIENKINNLPYMPYKFRKSIYFDHDDVRDLIFKGYVIPYLIDKQNSNIVVLGIVKYKNF